MISGTILIEAVTGASMRAFFTDWYPVFGVFFMAALLGIFILIYKGTLGATRPETVKATHAGPVLWEEVQGVDAAKSELLDVTEWLKDPDRFEALGARAPRGVLLYGPPGTGKTMLARAVAAQAGVDFFSASGSSFVEMFVGRGAARIRRLFKEARKGGRAVVFIDELDAVGGHRGSGAGDGGTSEREQALNQLLVELDGFERDPGTVIVIAASNNVEKLDPALLRPGRFDRQVLVAPPDRDGREAILHAHARNKPLGPDLDLTDVARKTTGMTGAQLANALNEAAIIAGRLGHEAIARDEEFAAGQRWRFRHLFVDEFQDATPLQIRLLRAWLGDSDELTVVGDPAHALVAQHERVADDEVADPALLVVVQVTAADASVGHLQLHLPLAGRRDVDLLDPGSTAHVRDQCVDLLACRRCHALSPFVVVMVVRRPGSARPSRVERPLPDGTGRSTTLMWPCDRSEDQTRLEDGLEACSFST